MKGRINIRCGDKNIQHPSHVVFCVVTPTMSLDCHDRMLLSAVPHYVSYSMIGRDHAPHRSRTPSHPLPAPAQRKPDYGARSPSLRLYRFRYTEVSNRIQRPVFPVQQEITFVSSRRHFLRNGKLFATAIDSARSTSAQVCNLLVLPPKQRKDSPPTTAVSTRHRSPDTVFAYLNDVHNPASSSLRGNEGFVAS